MAYAPKRSMGFLGKTSFGKIGKTKIETRRILLKWFDAYNAVESTCNTN